MVCQRNMNIKWYKNYDPFLALLQRLYIKIRRWYTSYYTYNKLVPIIPQNWLSVYSQRSYYGLLNYFLSCLHFVFICIIICKECNLVPDPVPVPYLTGKYSRYWCISTWYTSMYGRNKRSWWRKRKYMLDGNCDAVSIIRVYLRSKHEIHMSGLPQSDGVKER